MPYKRPRISELKSTISNLKKENEALNSKLDSCHYTIKQQNEDYAAQLEKLENLISAQNLADKMYYAVKTATLILTNCINRLSKTSIDASEMVFLQIANDILHEKSLREVFRDGVKNLNFNGSLKVFKLVSFGDKKIMVIKAVREFTELGLREAKDLVDTACEGGIGGNLLPHVNEDTNIQQFKNELEKVGAIVELQR